MKKKENKKEKHLSKASLGKKWPKKPLESIKVALVYDRVNKWGGAERVLLALHDIFPKAPLYTSVYDSKKAPWAKVFTVYTTFLQRIPFAKKYHQLFAPFMPFAFGLLKLEGYDVVISLTSEAAKGVGVGKSTTHICFCLTPTRYLWSGYSEYFPRPFIRQITKPLIVLLRNIDKKSAQNPHHFLAISKEVQKRIKMYYQRDAEVIYPPVTLGIRNQESGIKNKKDYFLVVSRLSRFTGYKRVDIAIRAATKLGIPLIVVGQGDTSPLKKIAGPTVKFTTNVSDKKLQEYYQGARALIFPANEDFGLVMVEAQAAGIPVIAYKSGGALEIVKEGITGAFFSKQTASSLIRVLKTFDETRYNSQSCKENAKRFSFSRFKRDLTSYIKKVKKAKLAV